MAEGGCKGWVFLVVLGFSVSHGAFDSLPPQGAALTLLPAHKEEEAALGCYSSLSLFPGVA